MREATTDGMLLVDKPAGVTSHDVVLAARRAFGESRIGHAGTLDPFATGLLVLLLGRATRLLPHLDGVPKEYEAVIALGTRDRDRRSHGAVVRRPSRRRRCDRRGDRAAHRRIEQIPPAYSRSAWRAVARTKPRAQATSSYSRRTRARLRSGATSCATAIDFAPTIACGGGTYIRALARDLGRLTGSAAHLAELRRVRSGPFACGRRRRSRPFARAARSLRPALDALPTIPHVRLVATTPSVCCAA
jgi:tRNA pseudouridine55 synthase